MIWLLIAILALGTVALKIAGPLIAGGRQPARPADPGDRAAHPGAVDLAGDQQHLRPRSALTLDARVVGLALGAILLVLRVPLIVALVVAAVACAALRAFG